MKIRYFAAIILPIVFLSSCTKIIHRNNFFIEGTFIGEIKDLNVVCTLDVKNINEEEFNQKNGVNVVFDDVKLNYFSLELNVLINDTENIEYVFTDLKPMTKSLEWPVFYEDKNGSILKPFKTSSITDQTFPFYGIEIPEGEVADYSINCNLFLENDL